MVACGLIHQHGPAFCLRLFKVSVRIVRGGRIKCQPSKHAGFHPEAFLVTASVQPESARIVYATSDFPHPFQFRSSKEGIDRIAQNRPGSDQDGLVMACSNASVLEASRCAGIIGPGLWQDATGLLPVFHFHTRFRSSTDVPDNILQNQSGSDLVLVDCVRFWPNGSRPEASQCTRIIRPASGQCFPVDLDWMRIGSCTFTGKSCGVHTLQLLKRRLGRTEARLLSANAFMGFPEYFGHLFVVAF